MKNAAKSWINAPPAFETWISFVNEFLADFPTMINVADIHMQMMKERAGKGESLSEFYFRMLALGKRGSLDDISIIRYIINGLHDSTMRKSLSAMSFQKCADLLRALLNVSTCDNEKITYNNVQTAKNGGQEKTANEIISDPGDNVSKQGPKCFNCNFRGHMAKVCPQPPRKAKTSRL